jgi:hypothetical protein
VNRGRPGCAGARLNVWGAPKWPPSHPTFGRAGKARAPLSSLAYVRARKNNDVPMPKKITFAVQAATKGGSRSARAKASAT